MSEWISVKDRLPETSGFYVVTASSLDSVFTTFAYFDINAICDIYATEWEMVDRMCEGESKYYCFYDYHMQILAWLPTPAPYHTEEPARVGWEE